MYCLQRGSYFYMGRKSKYSKKLKLEIVQRYEKGEGSFASLAKEIGINESMIRRWFKKYLNFGEAAFDERLRNKTYTKKFKEEVAQAYLSGKGSYLDLAIMFDIPAISTIDNWIKKYNSHIEQTDYNPLGDVYMTKSRKTTQEEREEIVNYCLKHDKDYKLTSKIFEIPYANVYQWVQKYIKNGYDGLSDKRGHHKTEEQLDEITLLKRRLEKVERDLKVAQMENRLLKKVDEIERGRYGVKADLKQNTKLSKK